MKQTTLRKQLAEARAEVERLKRVARTPREPIKGSLGGVLQKMRETKGLTIQGLMRKSGVAIGLISRIERLPEANPTLKNLLKLSSALDSPLSKVISQWEADQAK